MVDTTKVILAKKEAVYSTDAAPTPAANAILTRNFSSKPLQVDQIDRNLDLPTRGRSGSKPSNARKTDSFEVEIAGSGAVGTAPGWMELLEACSMAPAVLTAGTDAKQKFAAVNALLSSLTLYDWIGVRKSVGLGARGTFGWTFTAGAYPFFKFDLTAMVPAVPVTSAAPGVPDLTRWKDPVEVNNDNTAFLLDGYAAVLKSFTGNAAVDVKVRNLVGARYVQAGNHAITGQLVIEAVDPATKNYVASLQTGATIAVSLTHGIVAGNIVQLTSANLQILDITESEEDGKLMYTIDYGLNITAAGQDDLLLTAK